MKYLKLFLISLLFQQIISLTEFAKPLYRRKYNIERGEEMKKILIVLLVAGLLMGVCCTAIAADLDDAGPISPCGGGGDGGSEGVPNSTPCGGGGDGGGEGVPN